VATYQICYWKDIPAQIKVTDGDEELQVELSQRFQEYIDRVAMETGLLDSDEYLEHWHWGEPQEQPGSIAEVAEAVKKKLEENFPGSKSD